jgi:hypothetical protein
MNGAEEVAHANAVDTWRGRSAAMTTAISGPAGSLVRLLVADLDNDQVVASVNYSENLPTAACRQPSEAC